MSSATRSFVVAGPIGIALLFFGVHPGQAQEMGGVGEGQKIGDVTYFANEDPVTGEAVGVVIAMEEGEDASAGIGWRCMSDGLNVIYTGDYLIGNDDDEVRGRHRFDFQEEPSEWYDWNELTTGGDQLFWMEMDWTERFVENASSASEVALGIVDPADGERRTHVIEIDGLERALRRLECYPD